VRKAPAEPGDPPAGSYAGIEFHRSSLPSAGPGRPSCDGQKLCPFPRIVSMRRPSRPSFSATGQRARPVCVCASEAHNPRAASKEIFRGTTSAGVAPNSANRPYSLRVRISGRLSSNARARRRSTKSYDSRSILAFGCCATIATATGRLTFARLPRQRA
jgi:hypothetical protein